MKNWKSTNTGKAIYDELVSILQRTHPDVAVGADRVASAHRFTTTNAAELVDFTHSELHPETCEVYRELARSAAPVVRPSIYSVLESALAALSTDSVQQNKYRMGAIGASDLNTAQSLIRQALALLNGQQP